MKTLKVEGMSCAHCKAAVEEAAGKISGVRNASANPATGTLEYEESAPVDQEALKKAVRDIGFTA